MNVQDHSVDGSNADSLRRGENGVAPARPAPNAAATAATGSVAGQRIRVTVRMLGALLLGVVTVLGSIIIFRQGMLPLINSVFQPGPEWQSAIRRSGILLAAIAGYWAYVHWYERREVIELRMRAVPVLLGAASGAALIAIPLVILFAFGVYELVLFRGASPALLGVAVLIGIAATLEELVYRCLVFRIVERAWGTAPALAIQAVAFAVPHLENVERGGTGDAAAMLVSCIVLGLLWAGLFVLTRNLWVPVANHAAWNFTILLSGVPLSGIEDWRAVAPLESRYAGPDWLTGGIFGPESSLLVIAFATGGTVLLLHAARRRGAFLKPESAACTSTR